MASLRNIDGSRPYAGLVQGTDGNFYGTASGGGANDDGTVFEITSAGEVSNLYTFSGGINGANPDGGLTQGTEGTFYGTTSARGTIFSISVGLGPFVETRPTSGKVGKTVIILGTNLTGTSDVTFNGTTARFTVVSGSEIKATVPRGATTGPIQVTTPSGTLTTNMNFQVTR